MEIVVFRNGRILDVHGPYLSDGRNNDAHILRYNLQTDIHFSHGSNRETLRCLTEVTGMWSLTCELLDMKLE